MKEKDISFINHIEIDYKNKFVIGRGEKKIFIYNIEKKTHMFYTLDRHLYEKIYTARLVSLTDETFRC